jgi:hypothetical protein
MLFVCRNAFGVAPLLKFQSASAGMAETVNIQTHARNSFIIITSESIQNRHDADRDMPIPL